MLKYLHILYNNGYFFHLALKGPVDMGPASRDTRLSKIHASLLFYMKNNFVITWATSQLGDHAIR